MTARVQATLAWVVAGVCTLGAIAAIVLGVLNDVPSLVGFAVTLVAALSFTVTGAVLVNRLGGNLVGWLLCVVGASVLLLLGGEQYARYALKTSPGALPGPLVAAWVSGWIYAPMLTALAIWLPLLFPTGLLLSRRWRPVAWSGAAFLVLAVLGNGLMPNSSEVQGIGVVRNPFALPAAVPVLRTLQGLDLACLVVALTGSLASLVLRFRRAGDIERRQIKLVTAALALTPAPFLAHDLAPALSQPLTAVGLPLVPIAVAVAVLRYRLYDIDRVISRTVSYAVLTALLAAVYVGLVTVATRLLPTNDSLVVAASTLAVAALFQPMRKRIQRVVDRRFNCTKYDAERTVDAFSRRLRDEVDLEAVRTDLLAVIGTTMQPAAAGLWLRDAPEVR